MNEYFTILQIVKQNIEGILSNQTLSLEICSSAKNLDQTIQPCLKEIEEAALRLQNLLQPCFQQLQEAEDIWESKPNICNLSKIELLEEIGVITGLKLRVSILIKQSQNEILEEFITQWQEAIEQIKNEHFQKDKLKNKFKKNSLNIFEKDGLLKSLQSVLDSQSELIINNLKVKLKPVYQELIKTNSPVFEKCFKSLDTKTQNDLQQKNMSVKTQIEQEFKEVDDYSSKTYGKTYQETVNVAIQTLKQKSNLGISLDSFQDTTSELEKIITRSIQSFFQERAKLTEKWIEQTISFYNDFLEKQARYQEETPEIRQIEKTWLEEQRKQLNQIQLGIKQLINHCEIGNK